MIESARETESAAERAGAAGKEITERLDAAVATGDPNRVAQVIADCDADLHTTVLAGSTRARDAAEAAERALERARQAAEDDDPPEVLLRRLRSAIRLGDVKTEDSDKNSEYAAAAARLAQAGGYTLIQDHIDDRNVDDVEQEWSVQKWLREAAAILAALLFIAALVTYVAVENTEISAPAAEESQAMSDEGASTAPTDTAAGSGDEGSSTTEEAPAGTAPTTTASPTETTPTEAAVAEPLRSEKTSHDSTMPIALLVTGAVLLGLALFAPRASSISASKTALALTLADNDPFGQFAAGLSKLLAPPKGDGAGQPTQGPTSVMVVPNDQTDARLAKRLAHSPRGQELELYEDSVGMIAVERGDPGTTGAGSAQVSELAQAKAIEAFGAYSAAMAQQRKRRLWPFGR